MVSTIPIIDAHVHLWDTATLPRLWLADVPQLNQPFGLAEYARDTAATAVAGIVFVETDVAPQYALLEARSMVELAAHTPTLLGIIAAAPVEYGERTRGYLDALQRLGGPIKGVRRNLQSEPDTQFFLSDDFVAGVQLLAEYDWTFDLCIRHEQLPAVTALVQRCPQVRFVLDHLGKPPIRQGHLDPWREHLAQLALLPNVWCKLSGLLTEADHQRWRPEDLAPYITHALAVFGPERTLFGGDWPVLRLAASYQRWVTLLSDALHAFDEPSQQQFWAGTAHHVYHLTSTDGHEA